MKSNGKGKKMNLKQYYKKRNACFLLQVGIGILAIIATYVFTKNIVAAGCAVLTFGLLLYLSVLIYQIDKQFINETVSNLSKLVDVLTRLEEESIFPENEDTLVSKLQSKIIKLVRILKNKNTKSLEEQENIKALVSDISHQLKTPIANLIMYTDFLSDPSITERQRIEYIDIIRISVERLNFLSESMIKVSRLESGLIQLHPLKQTINETALIAIKNIFVKAREKNIEVKFIEEGSIKLSHDRNWTSEAIFNLLDNAVKYSLPNRAVTLTIKSFGMFVAIELADENAMISEAEQTRIFQRFYRGKNSANIKGIGVGLYLSREIAIKQGGYMTLSCSPNGNTFRMFLPIDT